MCGFKHCAGSDGCFLEGVSPCPNKPSPKTTVISRLGFHYDGFLEPDSLLSALGLDAETDPGAQRVSQDQAA